MEKLSERLKRLRKENKLTQLQVANLINLSNTAIYKYENGDAEPNSETLTLLAKIYNVSLEYLITGKDDVKEKGIKIPVLGIIPAGIPIEAIEDIIDYEEIPREWTKSGDYFALKVRGNSMEPRICSGDVVIVRKQENAESNDVCVVFVNGYDATLKQIKKEPNGIWLIPFNNEYSPAFYTNEQIAKLPIKIVGKVVELRGKF